MRPAKTKIRMGISETSLYARRNLGSLVTEWAQSEDSDQTGRMPMMFLVFAGRTGHFAGIVVLQLSIV